MTQTAKPLTSSMSPERSLSSNFLWALGSNVAYGFCQLGILIIVAKFGSPKVVGQFALGMAVATPIIEFAGLQLHIVQATDSKNENKYGDYFALRLFNIVFSLILICSLTVSFDYFKEINLLVIFIALAKAFESLSYICYGFLQKNERLDYVARSQIIRGILSLSSIFVGMYFNKSITCGVILMSVTWAILWIFYDIPAVIRLSGGNYYSLFPSWHLCTLRKLALLALPLGLAVGVNSFNANTARYFVEFYLGSAQLGFFAAIANLGVAARMIYMALCDSTVPRLSKKYAENLFQHFQRLLLNMLLISMLASGFGILLVYLFGYEILTLLFSSEYALYSNIFLLIAIGYSLRFFSAIFVSSLRAMRQFTPVFPIQLTSFLLLVVLLFLWTPKLGMSGVAWATVISSLVELIIVAIWTQRLIQRHV